MDNELTNTEQNTEQTSNEISEQDTVDLKELQSKLKALQSENGKLKQSVTNASADASKWKKQYQEKLSAEEKAEQDRAEQTAAMQTELEMLRKERNIAKISGALVANDIGMDSATANTVAEAMNAGDTDKVLDGIRQFIKAHDKNLRENAFRSNPTLQGGKTAGKISQAEFDSMGYSDRLKLYNEDPDLYKELTK